MPAPLSALHLAVKVPSSATWLGIPLRRSVGSWAVQKAGYISGKIAIGQQAHLVSGAFSASQEHSDPNA